MSLEFNKVVAYSSKKEELKEYDSFLCKKADKEISRGVTGAYAAMICGVATIITYDEHFECNSWKRLNSEAKYVLKILIGYLEENDELSEKILQAEDDAFENGRGYGTVAIHFQKNDWFFYLCVHDGIIHISTVVSNNVYYVNPNCELIVAVNSKNDKLFYGIEKNNRFEVSTGTKYKGGNGF